MIYVSAVMPTTPSRIKYVKKSIRYFLAQTFQDTELVISSGAYSEELRQAAQVADPDKVRYTRAYNDRDFKSVGMARNAVNDAADGRVIIHWDDDDWYAPERIADQVGHLISSGKQVVGYHDMLYYRESDGGLFKYRYRPSPSMTYYATGTSQCYWRDYWVKNQFTHVKVAEDSAFSIKASNENLLDSKDSCGMLVARQHAGNTSKVALGNADFPAISSTEFPKGFLAEIENERRLPQQ